MVCIIGLDDGEECFGLLLFVRELDECLLSCVTHRVALCGC